MKKHLTFALLAALSLSFIPGCGEADKEQAAAEAKPTDHAGYIKAMLTTARELDSLVNSVKDKASADAAAPKIEKLFAKWKSLNKGAEELGKPSEDLLRAAAGEIEEMFTKYSRCTGHMWSEFEHFNYYGSEALKKAYSNR